VVLPVSFFTLPRDSNPSTVLERLQEAFPLQLQEASQERVTYFDTFDWRLMDGEVTFSAEPRGRKVKLTLSSDEGETMEARSTSVPAFAAELEDGPFRKALAARAKIRRLLPQARAVWSRQLWAVLNEDQKTVARILVRAGRAGVPGDRDLQPVPSRLQLLPLKGYRTEGRKVGTGLRRVGAASATPRNELAGILEALGRPPERHSSSTVVPLAPGLRADEAAKLLHLELLKTLQVNLDGVLNDLDPEFLHEFRVAGRRARSALSQIKGVFPKPVVSRFGEEFRWLGTRTGPTRDLDVYLQKIPSYQDSLPNGVRDELIPLVVFLEKKKQQAHRRLVRSLSSRRYAGLVDSWSEFLEESVPETPQPPNAGRPIDAVARERILSVFHRILKKGAEIRWDTPAERLHRLRIDCKKLRYLVAFFQSLFPPNALAPLIKELKMLQDNLGDFNDLRLQSGALRAFADEMMTTGVGPPATLMAMGQLMGQLEAEQELERRAFHKRFRAFARQKNRHRFEELFG
jgi:CHAD domain-containing protein